MLLSFSDLLTMACSVIARLEMHGIHVHPASRLQSYVDAIEKAQPHEYSMPPLDLLRICHRALSELNDFTEILDVLDTVSMSDAWKHLVKQALGGGVTRSDEKRHMRARDTQFELVVAALLHRKGCAIQLTEPDIVAAADGVAFAVAAKRPRSRANLERIVRDAGKQIMRSGMQGLIAVDTTVIANLNDEHFVSEDGLEDERLISSQATEHAKDILRIAVKRFGADRFHGVLCRVAMPVWEPRRRQPGLIHQWTTVFLSPENDPLRVAVHRLFNSGERPVGYSNSAVERTSVRRLIRLPHILRVGRSRSPGGVGPPDVGAGE